MLHEVRLVRFSTSWFYRTRGIINLQDVITSHCRFASLRPQMWKLSPGHFLCLDERFLVSLCTWPFSLCPGYLFHPWQPAHWILFFYFSSSGWAGDEVTAKDLPCHTLCIFNLSQPCDAFWRGRTNLRYKFVIEVAHDREVRALACGINFLMRKLPDRLTRSLYLPYTGGGRTNPYTTVLIPVRQGCRLVCPTPVYMWRITFTPRYRNSNCRRKTTYLMFNVRSLKTIMWSSHCHCFNPNMCKYYAQTHDWRFSKQDSTDWVAQYKQLLHHMCGKAMVRSSWVIGLFYLVWF